jgi:dihydrofolate reductase
MLIVGSATLAQTLLQHDLIDEHRLMVHPTILGTGRQLYSNIGERKKLKLIETKTFGTGTIVLVYHPEKRL